MKAKRRAAGYETRIVRTALAATLPLVATVAILLITGGFDARAVWTSAAVIVTSLIIATAILRSRVVGPLRTLANLLTALREGDYSLRLRNVHTDDALGEVLVEANALRDLLQERRLEAEGATALVREVLASIDSAIFVFDDGLRLRLTNRAGERLLARPSERLTGEYASTLNLDSLLERVDPSPIEKTFPGAAGRFSTHSVRFRDRGHEHRLLVIEDLSRTLRDEERQAWQRLVRVLGHEIHNSLAPIRSIAESLSRLARSEPLPGDWRDDMASGLSVIMNRADSLTRFTAAYARLAQLPAPSLQAAPIGELVRRAAATEIRLSVQVRPGPDLVLQADSDQLEQALINLIRNAADASLERGGKVIVEWDGTPDAVEIRVLDEGPGLSGTNNLFVPFFTTKPGGTGIGLVLSRQIAEAHGGSLALNNRAAAGGCEAVLRLPRGR